ncbi:MAG: CoB--CoM heterodisulfide reductase iron-sulfur subunit A family protein [Desulfobacterales bacterium]|nr:CoB--CoM heterodisulfide reductase iron-sulfur subunit A family protein [Desulfobacterales bacterium]
MKRNKVLIIGGGIAGLSAALELSKLGLESIIVEKEKNIGGYASQFACKANIKCVKCGACIVHEKIQSVINRENISIYTKSSLKDIKKVEEKKYNVVIEKNMDCDSEKAEISFSINAVVMAAGFIPFNPKDKPYGYQKFKDVITNLDLERILKSENILKRLSDNTLPEKIAFIQCVGSRDSTLNHLWCSKVCCPSALRMANLIKAHQNVDITFFYIDIQSFGKDFLNLYPELKKNMKMIRSIPSDVIEDENGKLKITYFDNTNKKSIDEFFDIIVLSIGITPNKDLNNIVDAIGLQINDFGFLNKSIFVTGSITGPMNISETIGSAGITALGIYNYLKV